jgi:hypothetical protein
LWGLKDRGIFGLSEILSGRDLLSLGHVLVSSLMDAQDQGHKAVRKELGPA